MGLRAASQVCGSVVIGLALSYLRLEAGPAFAAALLEETYQMELWGEEAEALKRRENLRADLDAAVRFLALLRV